MLTEQRQLNVTRRR